MKRRTLLKTLAVNGLASAFSRSAWGQTATGDDFRERVLAYLESLTRGDGGYGWEGQEHSHLTPSSFVIGCYRLLQRMPPRKAELAGFVRTHHPGALKKLEQERRIFDYQQVQALVWLEEDASEFKDRILAWKRPLAYLKQYEQHGYPLFSSEMGVILARALLGVPASELPAEFREYLLSRRRANGTFNNTPGADGGDGHVSSTWWGLQAMKVLGLAEESKASLIDWLQSCQLPNGGFTFQPKPEFGGVDDVSYTWAAVRALGHLGGTVAERERCIAYLLSLANPDGGFADRPGWHSTPMATYYALDALDTLGAWDAAPAIKPRVAVVEPPLPEGLKVFSIQLEAHGQGSPAEAVDLAGALRIHLWGAKNAKPEWLACAQAVARERGVPVEFFVSNEEYGTWVHVPGLGTYSHTSDIVAPSGAAIGEALAKQGAVSWEDFRRQRLEPLERGRGRLIWQFGENEELVRMFLDESVEHGGYAAISTYHFGNPDFTNSEPFLHRWRGQIPFVALQDSHGPEPWWFADMTTGFRTLFLAKEPTWEGWLEALKNRWVVAVRHDVWSGGKTWMHASSRGVLDFVRANETQWRWWDHEAIQRPMVSLVAVRPEDAFEAGRPETGLLLRVRCAWENTPQGLLKQPLAELVSLTIDGQKVEPELVSRKRPKGPLLDDHYHFVHLPKPSPGLHRAKAVVRILATGAEVERIVDFTV